MHIRAIIAVLLGGGALLVSAARIHAQTIIIEKSTVGCQSERWTDITPDPAPGPGDAISIANIDDTWTAIRVRTSSGSAAIGRMTLTGSRSVSSPLDLLIALSSMNCLPLTPDESIASAAGSTWAGLTYGSNSNSVRDAVRLTAAISGDLTGSIDCGTVYRLQVGGEIAAGVTAHAGNDSVTNAAIAVVAAVGSPTMGPAHSARSRRSPATSRS